ncbi:MAG: LON peptidase substrate-binding domain-containing protein [Rhizobiaceae bacterium]|nr:LON peptidase substrate-binding domain-containing protein [Rhizobiaceae bacterium]MCV0407543.1 LON peptidase substrate-binding domain-containing protein [Rhizobiaceae bacterium]
MEAGNARYGTAGDLPDVVPVFPLSAALLLPGGRMPLNIFEPRYLKMVDDTIGRSRLIGMIQPRLDGARRAPETPELCELGCLGRIVSFAETGDGRYLISLHGVCRFRLLEELSGATPYRQYRISPLAGDLAEEEGADEVDRAALLKTFKAYLDANELEADWDSVSRAGSATLVNALSMMSPYGPAEKQALLEAPDLKSRAETLIAITEMALARGTDDPGATLQ